MLVVTTPSVVPRKIRVPYPLVGTLSIRVVMFF